MNKEFIPYEQALELKELGFDKPCFTWYWDDIGLYNGLEYDNHNKREHTVSAPTFSQAFRFFREKYNLHAELYTADMGAIEYCFQIRDLYSEKYVYDNFRGAGGSYMGTFNTPEEAELECLKKLIEICKK
jgi:hypothetical protein